MCGFSYICVAYSYIRTSTHYHHLLLNSQAIHHYRETERKNWNKKNELVINRIRNLAFPPSVAQLQLVHVLDLGKSGVIKPHIDSVRVSYLRIG